jgi:hypothetical protein
MRHVGTVIAAVVVGPLAWILLAIGQDRSGQVFENAQNGNSVDVNASARTLLLLAAAGILLGLIATLRFSPLGAVLTGVVYAASEVGLLIRPTWVLNMLNHKLTLGGYQVDPATPVRTGTTLLLGSLLLVGVVSVHRWRRWPLAAAETPAAALPDELTTPAPEHERPLGAEGLGLTRPGKPGEPAPAMAGGRHSFDSPRGGSAS